MNQQERAPALGRGSRTLGAVVYERAGFGQSHNNVRRECFPHLQLPGAVADRNYRGADVAVAFVRASNAGEVVAEVRDSRWAFNWGNDTLTFFAEDFALIALGIGRRG